MAKSKYVAKANTQFTDKDARKIGPILNKILEQADSAKVPDAVVETAKSPDSPLHRFFEWNDSKAAHKHRLEQARAMIRSIEIVRVDARDGAEQRVRAIEHLPSVGYVATESILKSVDQTQNLLDRFISEVNALTRRWETYSHLPEVAVILAAIKKANVVPITAKKAAPAKRKAA